MWQQGVHTRESRLGQRADLRICILPATRHKLNIWGRPCCTIPIIVRREIHETFAQHAHLDLFPATRLARWQAAVTFFHCCSLLHREPSQHRSAGAGGKQKPRRILSTDVADFAYVINEIGQSSIQSSSTMPFHRLDISFQTIRYVKRLALGTAERAVGQVDTYRTAHNPGFGYAMFVHHKNRAKTRVTDEYAAFFI